MTDAARPSAKSAVLRSSAFAPFAVRSFRFLWPANIATSWAFEMETLILGWYVLVETQSVFLLTVFASLQWFGTLISPMFGVVGDRIGHRVLLCAMRTYYALQAGVLMILAFTDMLTPTYVLVISGLMGMLRPSDMVMRFSLVGEIMPPAQLMGAMSVERTTSDSARVFGALSGAGLITLLGMGWAYVTIMIFYALSLLLTLGAKTARVRAHREAGESGSSKTPSPWRDLRAGFAYVWKTPVLLAAMCLAFLVNLTAYPLVLGLLPYVAKEIYQTDQTGLGYLVASFSCGGLIGSIALMRFGASVRAGRWMLIFCALWYVMLGIFSQMPSLSLGIVFLALAGCAQSFALIPLVALLLRNCDERFRGRIMGLRMFAIYGLPIGLLIAGPLIGALGYPTMALLYCLIGLVFSFLIAAYWHRQVWRLDAPANSR